MVVRLVVLWALLALPAARASAVVRRCEDGFASGVDYFSISGSRSTQTRHHLQVNRFYADAGSRKFETALWAWLKDRLQIRVTYLPGISQAADFQIARLDLALEALDRHDLRGEPLFQWVQAKPNRFTYKDGWHYVDKGNLDRLNFAYASAGSIPFAEFDAIYSSSNLDYSLHRRASSFTMDHMVVVNGRYATSLARVACGSHEADSPSTIQRLLSLIETLLARP